MADEWVLKSQQWVNSTYKGVAGYSPAPETGTSGWSTMFALTRALQIELGLSEHSDSFGPGTLSALTAAYPSITNATPNKNVVALLQCALWCKGYWGGTTWKTLDQKTSSAIARLRTDMGFAAAADVTPKMMKSLLTMDSYVLGSGGTALIRTIQQSLNKRYIDRADFFVLPSDGLFSRGVQQGLVFALQFELGIADGVATGDVGPMTRSKLKDAAPTTTPGTVDSTGYLIHLLQAGLVANGYYTDGPYDGSYSPAVVAAVRSFQGFAALPASGNADYATWCSLLVSSGDPERSAEQGATAADCSTDHVTPARARLLTDNGYRVIGRYLTNTPVADYNDKKIQPGELAAITGAGLRVFPIFQEGGDAVDGFSYARGFAAAQKAHAAARGYGFRAGATIYFAVDFDALETEVNSAVVPHFQGVKDGLASVGSRYAVGIYAARNTCRIVREKGLASLCFVSGMSTGYSGNLGFPLPQGWAFDQVKEYVIGSGTDAMNIDKNIASGRDSGADAFDPAQTFPDYADWLSGRAAAFAPSAGGVGPDDLMLQFLRSPRYADGVWERAAGPVNREFLSAVEGEKHERVFHTIGPEVSTLMPVDRLAAAMTGARCSGVPTDPGTSTVGDFLGWAGDLTRTLVEYTRARNSGERPDPYDFGRAAIGRRGSFDAGAHQADVDGCVLGLLTAGGATPVASALRSYYADGYRTRYRRFLDARFGGSAEKASAAAAHWFTTTDPAVADVRTAFLALDESRIEGSTSHTDDEFRALAKAWADDLTARVSGT
ncbi:glycoside hydrolase domain-containing protein [Rathayibacter tanaceti]|uniref:DUF1906 domain-containing protein n=2 Tax=Rathayibacter tanaceti TaxID=1671680 RepID=A0A162FVZ9_9MICO|nr:glycoside hydrolase domain-containing protein [Rathayibacter tanaceti]KZX20370.1 putative peptidoglycan binding domain protein [Rathayibacter tanaceti]QHC56607.1 DUF1906 domain-containing protein [Rathayibacter tanaceti]TCO36253.1 peptidoglycan hydrolase-like protein with peptidoglycan-binding domain [Rathayibacter tanaceti]